MTHPTLPQKGKAVTEFDYIIVGAGTAGCVLAARLTQDAGTRVLLLEAGGAERTRAMTMPDAWPGLLGTAADWADVTSAQAAAGPVPYPRGRGAGRVRRDQRHGPHPRPPRGLRRLGRGRGHRVGIRRICCPASGAASTPQDRAGTRCSAVPAARSGSARYRRRTGTRSRSRSPQPWPASAAR